MIGQKEIYRSIVADDNVKTSSLSIIDQIKLILKVFSNNDDAELETYSRVSRNTAIKKAALSRLIEGATEKMQKTGNTSVTLQVAVEFTPYLDEVIDTKYGYGRFYNFKVYKQDSNSIAQKYFYIKISTKNEDEEVIG